MELIVNPDESRAGLYNIARTVYAETGASSLTAVEAMCAMLSNFAARSGRDVTDVAGDVNVMPVLDASSPRHERLSVPSDDRGFRMCLRVVRRMLCGTLHDVTHGATRFHHADELPDWAVARGYIADIDGMLFYL